MKIWWKLYNNTGRGRLSWECKEWVRLLQQHFNQLALWVNKKNHLETWCILVYKKILIKKLITYSFKHTILHSLVQTCHIINDHNCLLRYFSEPASFSVECQSTWGPAGGDKRLVSSTPTNSSLQKKVLFFFFVDEQVSDMQTSTLSRNKYTRKQRKGVRRSNSFW